MHSSTVTVICEVTVAFDVTLYHVFTVPTDFRRWDTFKPTFSERIVSTESDK